MLTDTVVLLLLVLPVISAVCPKYIYLFVHFTLCNQSTKKAPKLKVNVVKKGFEILYSYKKLPFGQNSDLSHKNSDACKIWK